jgi:predicted nucleic acid-binding protein
MTFDKVVVDANVFVASLIKKEKHYEDSLKAMRVIAEKHISLLEPEVVLFEVGTSFHRKRGNEEIDDQDADNLMNLFFRLPLMFVWEPEVMQRASKIARQLSFKGLSDSYYLAIAEQKEVPLITLDEELIRKGKTLWKAIYRPAEFLESVSQ